MQISNISDVLYTTRGFRVTINVLMDGVKSNTDNPNFQNPANNFINIKRDNLNKDTLSFRFNTYHKKFIRFETTSFDSESRSLVNGPSFVIPTKLFGDLEDSIDIAKSWLTLKKYEYLFARSSTGITGIGGPPPYKPTVERSDNSLIRFHPAVYIDRTTSIKSEGIAITRNDDTMMTLPCSDFMGLYNQLKVFLRSSYSNTLTLVNTAMNMATFAKSKL